MYTSLNLLSLSIILTVQGPSVMKSPPGLDNSIENVIIKHSGRLSSMMETPAMGSDWSLGRNVSGMVPPPVPLKSSPVKKND